MPHSHLLRTIRHAPASGIHFSKRGPTARVVHSHHTYSKKQAATRNCLARMQHRSDCSPRALRQSSISPAHACIHKPLMTIGRVHTFILLQLAASTDPFFPLPLLWPWPASSIHEHHSSQIRPGMVDTPACPPVVSPLLCGADYCTLKHSG